MPIVPDKDRKNAFSPRLKGKREKLSDERSEMTPDEIRAFKKFIADAFRMVENASCVVEEPSHEQVQELDDDVNELAKRIESLRYQLVGKYAK